MIKLDPKKLIDKLNLDKESSFKYLETHTIKDFKDKFGIETNNQFRCIVDYWGGYKTPKNKKRLICIENGKKSSDTPEKLLISKLNGSRGYELFDDVIKRIDYDEFIKDYNLPMSKKQLAQKYICTRKMIDKVINYYSIRVSYENFCLLVSNSKTPEIIKKQKECYKNTMNKLYGVDNYFQSEEFKNYIKLHNLDRYGVQWYAQSEDFRKKFHIPFKSYYCDGEHFDSSWELVYWIYCKDHNKNIKREPLKLKFYYDGVEHTYYPDFLCNNDLIEIKGTHMLDENKKLKAIYKYDNQGLLDAKQRCMDENNVIIYTEGDLVEMFKYFNNKGYKLEDFKIKNGE